MNFCPEKKNYHPCIKERVAKTLTESEVAITGIIALELLGGAATEKEYERLKVRLDALHYMETSKTQWDNAARLAFNLHRKGVSVTYIDILIAEAAIREDAILVHADSHFETIAKHSALRTENLTSLI